MKKIITLILLFISIISFGQKSEYKKANKLYIDKQYAEANVILEKILNKEYGNLNEELEFYSLQLNLNCYYLLNDFKAAYPKAQLYLNFIKNTSEGFIVNKDDFITKMKAFIEELKSKIPQDSNSTSDLKIASESNSQPKTETTETKVAETAKPASDDKIVALTVSGTGKTLEEAKLNALRSAIEQAFGAFISSKTEILNDNLVKDEIVSVASGNIEKYDIVSQVEKQEGGYAITLNVSVSVVKLTSFAESKGVVVEFKGGVFSTNIKLQKLNEKNELKTITNIFGIMHEGMQSAYDYKLKTGEPTLDSELENSYYAVGIFVSVSKNENYEKLKTFLTKSLNNLSMKQYEIESYNKLQKPIFTLDIAGYDKVYLRNAYSLKTIISLFINENYYLSNFEVSDGTGNIFYGPDLDKSVDDRYILGISNEAKNSKTFKTPFLIRNKNGSFIYHPNENLVADYSYSLFYKQDELEKINSFDVKSSGIKSKFKYGGFVLYEDKDKAIISSPYVVNLEKFTNEDIETPAINTNNNLATSAELFSAKQNTIIISNRSKNNIGGRILEFNKQNSTDWFIPSKNEVILMCEKLFTYKLNLGRIDSYNVEKKIGTNGFYDNYVSSTDDTHYGRPEGYLVSMRKSSLQLAIITDVVLNNPLKWQTLNFKEFKFNTFYNLAFDKETLNFEYSSLKVLPISYIKLN